MDIDYHKLRTVSLENRKHRVTVGHFGTPVTSSVRDLVDRLPDLLAGRDLKALVAALEGARARKASRIWALGAHVVKCGITGYMVRLMEAGYIDHIALNGAGVIHDFELALVGATSEDVAEALADGSFGMARETSERLSDILTSDEACREGLGPTVARALDDEAFPYRDQSLLARASRCGVGVSVHPALGTDVLHYHPRFDWERVARASRVDFDRFVRAVGGLEGGGVHLNVGSAVLLPEIFLKAVSVVRNLGFPLTDFTTVVLDMIDHYRPRENVLHRPGGRPIQILGHHEILVPLLCGALAR